jgi:hypothetical protein
VTVGEAGPPEGPPPGLREGVRLAQVIVGALLMGQMAFVAVVGAIHGAGAMRWPGSAGWNAQTQMLTVVCAALTATAIPLGYVMRSRCWRAAIERTNDPSQAIVASTIIAAALFESFGLFGVVICLVAGSLLPNVVFPLISIGTLLSIVPRSGTSQALDRARRGGVMGGFSEPQKWRP